MVNSFLFIITQCMFQWFLLLLVEALWRVLCSSFSRELDHKIQRYDVALPRRGVTFSSNRIATNYNSCRLISFSFHFKDKFRGLKTAPEDSLTFFLAVCVCIVYHSYGGENICAEHVHRLFFEMATTLSLPSPFLLIVEIQNQSVHDVQSQQRNRSAGANENLKQKHVNCLKRGKTRVFKLWFALVFHLIDWENSAGFLDQSQYEEK